MGMNIKNPRVEQLAKKLAEETGQNITAAVEQALQNELSRLRRNDDFETRKARVEAILRRSGPTAPGLTSDHSDLYDEVGLPK
ncbi:MAG TPA: type II toxin-antitoxin system VapB family antitoxin [Rhabdaerophilum sp.]|jgi:antitoxin VapB|nr:type II toxin-antitoxin system VapB family antitoxin [Rhabdaerophilum sp.]